MLFWQKEIWWEHWIQVFKQIGKHNRHVPRGCYRQIDFVHWSWVPGPYTVLTLDRSISPDLTLVPIWLFQTEEIPWANLSQRYPEMEQGKWQEEGSKGRKQSKRETICTHTVLLQSLRLPIKTLSLSSVATPCPWENPIMSSPCNRDPSQRRRVGGEQGSFELSLKVSVHGLFHTFC